MRVRFKPLTLAAAALLLAVLSARRAATEPTAIIVPTSAAQARDDLLQSKKPVTLARIAEVNRLIEVANREADAAGNPGAARLEPLVPEHVRNYAVFVYQLHGKTWVRDDERSFATHNREQAVDYVKDAKGRAGWSATTNARERAPLDNDSLPPQLQKLVPLHTPVGRPRPGDWLDAHDEAGQNYRQYLASRPVRATPQRRTLYVQPLGEFTATERKIVGLSAEFMRRYFQLPVVVLKDIPLSIIPDSGRRQSPLTGELQILSTYVLDDLLRPRLPADALALIAFTSTDLWPGQGWNFVFGQASLEHRVGVWSMHRLGDPDAGPEPFLLTLRRTLGVAAHETGHMLSMPHCTFYECCMCGSNHLEESDRYPLWLCPQCLAKLLHSTAADPAKRFGDLIEFAKQHDLDREAEFWQKSLETMER